MYSVTIVGGGAIACGYDNPEGIDILTHINGAFHHQDINLDAIIETSVERQEYILNKWGNNFNIYSTLNESLHRYKSDIFVIATPTDTHLNVIAELLEKHHPKLIICEKPIVIDINEFYQLNKLLENTTTKIITNFIRRFDPSLNTLKNIISKADKKYHFYGTFTKGLVHNGSHMIDLVNMLVGKISKISSINKRIVNNDIFGQFLVNTDFCNGIISNIETETLSIFELDIYTDIAKISIVSESEEIMINYIDKTNLAQDFEIYSVKNKLDNTLNEYALNSFKYAIKLIENDVEYKKFSDEQFRINKLIFDTKKKLLELR